MPRERNPNRDKAKQIWLEHNGDVTNRRIAEQLGENEKVVAVWKQRDKWNVVQQSDASVVQHNKGGAPKGNKNAQGNKGGDGGPRGNNKAVKHGFFRRIFPDDEETHEIIGEIQIKRQIDILWENIVIQYTAIARAQRIMFVKDKDDETKVLVKEKNGDSSFEQQWEYQHAWDKQATFLQAQSRAMATLQSLIKQYEDMCRIGEADEEQRLRIQKLKGEVALLEQKATKNDDKPIEIVIKRRGESL